MTDDETTAPDPAPEYDDQLRAEVAAAQAAICTQVVPEALELRLAAAAAVPEGEWRRNAGASDPKVRELEAPFRRTPIPGTATETPDAPKRRARKATGSRRSRNQKRS